MNVRAATRAHTRATSKPTSKATSERARASERVSVYAHISSRLASVLGRNWTGSVCSGETSRLSPLISSSPSYGSPAPARGISPAVFSTSAYLFLSCGHVSCARAISVSRAVTSARLLCPRERNVSDLTTFLTEKVHRISSFNRKPPRCSLMYSSQIRSRSWPTDRFFTSGRNDGIKSKGRFFRLR